MAGERSFGMFKAIMGEMLETDKVSDVVYGTVKTLSPVSIELENRLTLTQQFLVLSPFCYERIIYRPDFLEIAHTHVITDTFTGGGSASSELSGFKSVTLWHGIKQGDRVVLIRAMKGQRYFVLWKDGGL